MFKRGRYTSLRSLMNCYMSPCRSDYIIVRYVTLCASGIDSLYPTPFQDSRCTFLAITKLRSGLSHTRVSLNSHNFSKRSYCIVPLLYVDIRLYPHQSSYIVQKCSIGFARTYPHHYMPLYISIEVQTRSSSVRMPTVSTAISLLAYSLTLIRDSRYTLL